MGVNEVDSAKKSVWLCVCMHVLECCGGAVSGRWCPRMRGEVAVGFLKSTDYVVSKTHLGKFCNDVEIIHVCRYVIMHKRIPYAYLTLSGLLHWYTLGTKNCKK